MNRAEALEGVLLTGVVGSGKTSLAIEMGEILGGHGIATAVIDLDWLGWWHGPPGDVTAPFEMIVRNLESVWPNFRSAGATRLILARMIQDRGELDALRRALPDVELTVARVEASEGVIERRLRRRDSGAELDEHLELLARLPADMTGPDRDGLRVNNDDRSIGDVATEILVRLAWI